MSPVSAFGNALLVAGIDCLSGTLPTTPLRGHQTGTKFVSWAESHGGERRAEGSMEGSHSSAPKCITLSGDLFGFGAEAAVPRLTVFSGVACAREATSQHCLGQPLSNPRRAV